jgi:hypothetical protein
MIMPNRIVLGSRSLLIEDGEEVARESASVELAEPALARIRLGRQRLEERLAGGDRIYGVNTGVGGNIKYALGHRDRTVSGEPDDAPFVRHGCAVVSGWGSRPFEANLSEADIHLICIS